MDFTQLKELANSVRSSIDETYKHASKGTNCNLPQIFTSNLFSAPSLTKSQETDQFMHLSLINTQQTSSNMQIGQVKNLLAEIGQKKQGSNFEAGSYMATLEYTMRSINGIKDML